MIIADTSVWIDHLNDRTTLETEALYRATEEDGFVMGDLVMMEILQGIRLETRFQKARHFLGQFTAVSLCGPEVAVRAAENFRLLRRRGVTVRSTINVVIATWCIENDASIIHNDRDLRAMEEHLGLRAY